MSFTGSTLASAPSSTDPSQTAPSQPVPLQPAPQQAALDAATVQPSQPAAQPGPVNGPSRLNSVLARIVGVVSTGLAGLSDKGRPSFVSGLGEGARSAQAQQAQQQEIKFKSFDDQVRLANLHHQDQELQLRTQEQQDAHINAQHTQADWDEAHGITFDPHPNDGQAVMDTLASQTATNGAASVPAGTHLSADGRSVNVPDNSSETAAGMLMKYKQLQGPLSLPALPQNAQFVPQRNLDVMTHKLGGFKFDGTPLNHDDLPTYISSLQSQRDALAKSGTASEYQLQTVDNTLGILKSNLKALDDHAAQFAGQNEQSKEQGKIDAQMSPQGRALATNNEKLKEQAQDNAAGNRNQGASPTPDPFGVTSTLDTKTYNHRYDTFGKVYVQPLTKTDQQLSQFANIQSDIDKNGNMTGAESVVGLFNAIGISASPLKGMGFRINNNTVEEHANARGLGQSLYQKLLGLKSGDVVTPQQLKDYASIANQARESQYSSAIDEARRQNLPVDFLPKGNGSQIDPSTARMYMRAANGDPNKARTAAQQAGWRMGQ